MKTKAKPEFNPHDAMFAYFETCAEHNEPVEESLYVATFEAAQCGIALAPNLVCAMATLLAGIHAAWEVNEPEIPFNEALADAIEHYFLEHSPLDVT